MKIGLIVLAVLLFFVLPAYGLYRVQEYREFMWALSYAPYLLYTAWLTIKERRAAK